MALSMFLRSSACLNPVLKHSVARMGTQPSTMQCMTSSNLPVATILLKDTAALVKAVKSMPIISSTRSLGSSAPLRSFAKGEHAHDHAKLWVVEKLTTALMVPLVPAALIYPHKVLDCALAILVTAHSFWGLQACVVEYIRTLIFGHAVPKLAMLVVYSVTMLQLGGLLYLTFNGMGLAKAFWKFWLNLKCPPDKFRDWPLVPGYVEPKGLEAIAVDYVRASVVGPILPKVAIALVYLISIATLGGLFYLISHDVGLGNAVRNLWAAKSQQKA